MRGGVLKITGWILGFTVLAGGCSRDFALPGMGSGPLRFVSASLSAAPRATTTFQVAGGTPPYAIAEVSPASGAEAPKSIPSRRGGAHLYFPRCDFTDGCVQPPPDSGGLRSTPDGSDSSDPRQPDGGAHPSARSPGPDLPEPATALHLASPTPGSGAQTRMPALGC